MLKFKIAVFYIFIPYIIFSQNITGKVYDDKSTAKNIKIINITQSKTTFTNNNGDFTIEAKINDSITFSSIFYKSKSIKLIKDHFENILVIELKKKINELDQVLLKSEPIVKVFDETEYNTSLKAQIKEDIKRNPHLYESKSKGGFDFIKIGTLIVNLFKKKKKKKIKAPPFKAITYKEFEILFNKDSLFNEEFLTGTLKIPKEFKSLFFDFCDAKKIDATLLSNENKLLLLDTLVNFSSDFLAIIKNDKKTN